MWHWLTELTPWSTLNRLGKSRLLRSSYLWLVLVPMVAKLLVKIGPEIHIPLWKTPLTITLGLPFSWKMFYFSAVGFAVASFIYSLRCPAIIRDYDRYSEFHEEGRGSTQLITAVYWLVVRAGRIGHGEARWIEHFISSFCILPTAAKADFSSPADTNRLLDQAQIPDQNLPEAFWSARLYADYRSSTLARLTCGVSYIVAFVFVVIVLAQNFLYVWKFVA